jgi:hypothetical protein
MTPLYGVPPVASAGPLLYTASPYLPTVALPPVSSPAVSYVPPSAPLGYPSAPLTPGRAIGLPDHLPGEPTGYQTTTVHPN